MKLKIILLISLSFIFCSCRKYLEVGIPVNQITNESVFASDQTAISAVTEMYTRMANDSSSTGGMLSLSFLPGLSSDELSVLAGQQYTTLIAYYNNRLTVDPAAGSEFWNTLYFYLYRANASMEGINQSDGLSYGVKQQLWGECRFMRAFCLFYLVNLYGDIPLVTTSDYNTNATMGRTPSSEIYQQIISDLTAAQDLLMSYFPDKKLVTETSERVRPTKWAALSLLARTYLYEAKYAQADSVASLVIRNTSLFNLTTIDNAFLKNNQEAIWQIQPVIANQNTPEAWYYVLNSEGPTIYTDKPFYLNSQLLNAFEPGDQRKEKWVNTVTTPDGSVYSYPYKYKSATSGAEVTEYSTVFRLAELYLIKAEALARLGDQANALVALNKIRFRAGLTETTAITSDELIEAIIHEKQVELFSEWGHRWLDIKRINQVDAIMNIATPLKAGNAWLSYQKLYPIPLVDIQRNGALTNFQNPGY